MDITEEIILEAAKRLFLRHGYAETTTTEVSARAGLNKSPIHFYFRTKNDLYRKVIDKLDRFLIFANERWTLLWKNNEKSIPPNFEDISFRVNSNVKVDLFLDD